MGQHAKLSPSASGTWMTCSGQLPLYSKLLSDKTLFKSDNSSVYAEIGTAIHEVCENILNDSTLATKDYVGATVNGHEMTEDHMETAQVFLDYVNSIPHDFASYEQRVKVPYIDDCWGTADVIKIKGNHLYVIDLKTGAGVRVDAHENTQGLCYAAGSYDAYADIFDIEKITFIIVQPPLDHISDFTFGPARLEEFGEELKDAVRRMEEEPEVYTPSEKACKFCACKPYCPAQHELAQRAAQSDFTLFKKSELTEWGEMLPILKDFVKGVEDRITKDLKAGRQVGGFKLVEGKGSREWKSTDKLEKAMASKGIDVEECKTEPQLLSPAQMETLFRKEKVTFDLGPHILRKPGNPTLTSADDPRSSIDPNQAAKDDFKDLK